MHSCLYSGQVRHRRFRPIRHAFTYSLFLMYLDLDELPTVFTRRWLWANERFALAQFRRTDHFGDPHVPLAQAVSDLVEQHSGRRPEGPIRLLTHLRYFGYCFNPVSFYFCYDRADQQVETIVAEVTNTPWGERHCYVLGALEAMPGTPQATQDSKKHYRLRKTFHVSPFMDMDVDYAWHFCEPGRRLTVHMENRQDADTFFEATLTLARQEISGLTLAVALMRYPFMTGKVIAAIYFQALRLWLKKAPFYPHPAHNPTRTEAIPRKDRTE